MTDRFVGPVPTVSIPAQPSWTPQHCLSWGAFDVPRIWDMVESEGNDDAVEQVNGFLYLADFLLDQYRIWRQQRDRIAEAWQSPAATAFLATLDKYGEALLSDEACARQTAHAWNRTVEALTNARSRIKPLMREWDEATKDPDSSAWQYTANRLNQQARKIMVETDMAVADARPLIASPLPFNVAAEPAEPIPIDKTPVAPTDAGQPPVMASRSGSPRVPPVPGYEPVGPSPELAASGEALPPPPGAPRMVPPVPGTPVSMLPIQPGNVHAPFGGAYILPGPGVGRGGYVVPMPQPPMPGQPAGPRALQPPTAAPPGTTGGAGGGMMPVPMAGAPGGGGGGHGALYRRANVSWETDKGVPPVIKIDEDEFVPNQPTPRQEDEFRDWFTDLAYPWRAEFKSSEGAQVTIRTVKE